MLYSWHTTDMMPGFGLGAALMWLVVFVDLVLLGVWLWMQVTKNHK